MSIEILAPMPGKITEILVNVGDQVGADDDLMILEAMKMENPICAPEAGKVEEIKVSVGAKVSANQCLMTLSS